MGSLFSINSPLWNAVNKLLHFLWLSILWLICCIPIVTAGAATTALYSVLLKYAKNEEGYITSSFFRALKQNLKQGVIIWCIFLFFGLFLGADLIVYGRSGRTDLLSMIFITVFFSLLLVFLMMSNYVYAILAKYDNSVKRTILNSFIMSVRHWPSSISMLIIFIAFMAVGTLVFPPLLFFAPAGITYINSKFLIKIFDNY